MLADRIAIVTGAGQGIGRAIAIELARAGADVVACGRRLEPLEAVAKEVRGLGRRALALSCDVQDAAQVDRVVTETARALGPVDLLVNNAGYRIPRRSISSRTGSGTRWWAPTSPASSSSARRRRG